MQEAKQLTDAEWCVIVTYLSSYFEPIIYVYIHS